MKQMLSYAIMPGYEDEILKSGKNLKEYIASLGLDGAEVLLYRDNIYSKAYAEETVGVHLRYWPNWYPLYCNDRDTLLRYNQDDNGIHKYYDAANYEEWIKVIHDNIQAALRLKPEYLVWHVADATLEECYTYNFAHSDLEIVEAAAKVFNKAAKDLPEEILVLFENLWWPGLTLKNKEAVKLFFELIEHKNSGIMLDTGHLMNTNWNLETENQGIDYILQVADRLGEYKTYIKGIHLNCSLSGSYMKSLEHKALEKYEMMDVMHYICQIDRHRPFSSLRVKEIIDFINPMYVTHELYYSDFLDLEKKIRQQMKTYQEN